MAQRSTARHRSLVISPPPSMLEIDKHAASNGDSVFLNPASITSSITEWEWENGRRYHAHRAGSYPLPNDEKELDRLDLKHHIMMLLCDDHLHLAPLVNPLRILDIGTGTGIWAIQMGDQYPESTVIGTDLSPIQPSWIPDNVRFEIDDVEDKEWSWPDNYFDYIHSRFMVASISSWPRLIRKAFQHCKPGGYFEMQELDPRFKSDDGSLGENANLVYYSKLICEASASYNRPIPYHHEYFAWFEKAGFVDVKQVFLKSPTNSWPKDTKLKEVGRYQMLAHIEGLEGVSLGLLCRVYDWTLEEVKILMAKLRPELKEKAIHSYQTTAVIVGRKPATSQASENSADAAPYGQAPLTPESSTASPGEVLALAGEPSGGRHPEFAPQMWEAGSLAKEIKDLMPVAAASELRTMRRSQ